MTDRAVAVIIAHNHTSGDLKPSVGERMKIEWTAEETTNERNIFLAEVVRDWGCSRSACSRCPLFRFCKNKENTLTPRELAKSFLDEGNYWSEVLAEIEFNDT